MAGTIVNGQAPEADSVMNAIGSNFNDTAQNIFNADYLGFDSRLSNTGTPDYKNVFYSTFTSDDVGESQNMVYDSTNDLYKTTEYFIIIEASSFGTWSNGTNDTYVKQEASGRWIIYCDTGSLEIQRAQIMKSLFFGTSGSNQLILDFTSVTSVKSTDSRDIGKRGHYANTEVTGTDVGRYTGTFSDTSTNTNCSSWSNLFGASGAGSYAQWEIPSGSINNSAGQSVTSNELGTDTSGDELDNPSNCQLETDGTALSVSTTKCVILCSDDISWSNSGDITFANIDFFTDHSIPDFTSVTNVATSFLIFKDTTTESVTNAITVINSTIDGTSSEQISISADEGSNYTDVENTEIARPTAGTGRATGARRANRDGRGTGRTGTTTARGRKG